MGMVVRTNTMSINAYRQLGMNNSAVSKSLEKLSSGFRINRAGDDASGLAISEKMKAQINGLEQASANAQDGISLIQTAEGATTEIHNMLNRMVTLATKSANGTIQDDVDRDAIQTEVDALKEEITRIAKSTNFNGINLLDGSMSEGVSVDKATVAGAAATTSAINASASTSTTIALGDGTEATDGSASFTVIVKNADGSEKEITVDGMDVADGDGAADADTVAAALNANSDFKAMFKADSSAADGKIVFTSLTTGSEAPTIIKTATNSKFTGGVGDTITVEGADAGTQIAAANTLVAGDSLTINGKTFSFVANGKDTTDAPKDTIGVEIGANLAETVTNLNAAMDEAGMTSMKAAVVNTNDIAITSSNNGSALKLQVGDTNADFNHVSVSVDNLTASGLGIDKLDVSTQEAAGKAIQTIKDAINQVSTNRGNLGALQNRLDYTINNLDTTNENMTAANSRIRDTDMAKEMMNYTKMNILTQAAQAMLAQANQQPQSILQLLQ